MSILKLTGGARIGRANATWQLARLTVTNDLLELNAGIVGILVFQPGDIIAITPYRELLVSKGIRIEHRVDTYKEKAIFWTHDPDGVIADIEETGFLDPTARESTPQNEEIKARQRAGSFPYKKHVAIGVVVAWSALFSLDLLGLTPEKHGSPIRAGGFAAVAMVFLLAVSLLFSAKARQLLLKEGLTRKDISNDAFFFILVLGFMLMGLSLVVFAK